MGEDGVGRIRKEMLRSLCIEHRSARVAMAVAEGETSRAVTAQLEERSTENLNVFGSIPVFVRQAISFAVAACDESFMDV